MNCSNCGLLIGHGAMGTVLPLCQCGWRHKEIPQFYIRNSPDRITELEAERDDALQWKLSAEDGRQFMADDLGRCERQLATAQAHNVKLREALITLLNPTGLERERKDYIYKLLSQPDDSTALDELLARQYAKGYADGQGV